jgi:putative ABC transport system permease protein
MVRNIFKNAFRRLLRNGYFTTINVTGLVIALTASLLVIFYVVDEISYDRYNLKADRIFRVNTDLKFNSTITSRAIAPPVAASLLTNNFPEIEKAVRFLRERIRFKKDGRPIMENKGAYTDPAVFDIFTLPVIDGNSKTALQQPNAIVITESFARKYFDQVHVAGKTLSSLTDDNNERVYTITAVIKDIPPQSHFNFDYLLSMRSFPLSNNTNFAALYPFSTYVLLKEGSDYKKLQAKFPTLIRQQLDFIDDLEKNGDFIRMNLTPLTDIHLTSDRTDELGINGNTEYVRIFIVVAVFILLIACINFITLSTARYSDRAREVALRKVLGSGRMELIMQLLCESVLITLVATLLAAICAWALLPVFNDLAGKEMVVSWQTARWSLPLLLIIIIVTGIISGSYPAFFLSAFRPIHVLKGKLSTGFKRQSIRNILVVVQFAVSVFLIIATLVIYSQLNYVKSKDIGFNRDQVLMVKNVSVLEEQGKLLKQQIKQLPGVVNATLGSFVPSGTRRWRNFISTNDGVFQTEFWPVDADYIPTMGMHLSKGRNFSNVLATDSSAMIINEAAAKAFSYADNEPLNKKIFFGNHEFTIIGVVKDFNFNSFKENIDPLVMLMPADVKKMQGDNSDALCVRFKAGNVLPALRQIEHTWKNISPLRSFDYSFLDEEFDALYRSEQRMSRLFIVFTGFSLFVACLGLFGLSAFAAEQRTKEIGIRRVLGASVMTIVVMLFKQFIRLIGIAILISSPVAWIIMHRWLQNYAYRVSIQGWVFAVAALAAVLIAVITISYQSLKAATSNPVKSLRAE